MKATEAGYTLVELVVVLLIMAILMYIALPAFLGTKNSANGRVAESNLQTAAENVVSAYVDANQVMTTDMATQLAAETHSLKYQTTAPTQAGEIGVIVTKTHTSVYLSAYATSVGCFWAAVNESATTNPTYHNESGVEYGAASGACSTTPPSTWSATIPAATKIS